MSRMTPKAARSVQGVHVRTHGIFVVAWLALLILVGCSGGPPPIAPSDVVATAGPGTISLGWSDNSEDETAFAVLRAQGDAGPTVVTTLAADSGAYTDDDVNGDAPYTYWVEAVGPGGRSRSAPSNAVRPTTVGRPIVDPNDPVGVSLNTLGIDTTASPRLGDDGNPLPDDYLPLGQTVTLGVGGDAAARYELFIGGPRSAPSWSSSVMAMSFAPISGTSPHGKPCASESDSTSPRASAASMSSTNERIGSTSVG